MGESVNNQIDELMLHAYVDGELCEADGRLVEEYLQTHPEAMALVESIQKQNRLLKTGFDPVLDEEIPDFLLEAVTDGNTNDKKKTKRWFAPYRVASLVLPLVLGGILGWGLKPIETEKMSLTTETMSFVKQARLAHVMYTPEKLHPVDVTSKHEKHLVAWISKRLGIDIETPDLTGQGFKLVGGRLLPNETGPSAQFMYENSQGQRLTLYVNKNYNKEETAFEFFEDGDIASFYWVDKSLVYALTGDLNRQQLLDISHHIYRFYNKENGELQHLSKI